MLSQPLKQGRRTSNLSYLATPWVNQTPQPTYKGGASSEIRVVSGSASLPIGRIYAYLSSVQNQDAVVVYNGIQTVTVERVLV